MILLQDEFLKIINFMPADSVGKIIKSLITEKTDSLSFDEQQLYFEIKNKNDKFNNQKQKERKNKSESAFKAWETRKRKKAEQLANAPSVSSVVTVPAPVQPPKKLTLKEKNPVFWEAIQRKKHVLTDQLI